MKRIPARRFLLVCALLLAAGCLREHTGVVIGVATDLFAPDELDRVVLTVHRGGVQVITQEWQISGIAGQELNLPGSFDIYPKEEDQAPTVELTLIGYLGPQEVVQRSATLTMIRYETLFLRMALVARCKNDKRPCASGETCIEGACVSEQVDATLLPRYGGGPPREFTAECHGRTVLRDTATRQPLLTTGEDECADGQRCVESICYGVAPHCRDGSPDEDESDKDCGGASCAGCKGRGRCSHDSDCLSGFCNERNGACAATLRFDHKIVEDSTFGRISLVADDFDEDGDNDLIVARVDDGQLLLYANDSKGAFTPTSVRLPTADSPAALAIDDFDGDGVRDLAVAYRGFAGDHNGVQVFFGEVGNLFARSAIVPLSARPAAIASGDLNGDDRPDLVIANPDQGTISVLLNDGLGAFPSVADYPAGPVPLAIAITKVDSPHSADVVVASTDFTGIAGQVSVLHNLGAGTLGPADHYQAGLDPRGLAIGDFDSDGLQDLAVLDAADGSVDILLNKGESMNDPLGRVISFQQLVETDVGTSPVAMAVGDFQADTSDDLVVVSRGDGTINILAHYKDGSFLQTASFRTGTHARAIAIADFDGDSQQEKDMAVATDEGLVILLNTSY
ncbi:MAG TPA: VCBS repeat-containing protein [Polyangia bacterium]|jgi:hypothetical protein|nr:VCBS repeat-containing protein [Polyangia bacterium]